MARSYLETSTVCVKERFLVHLIWSKFGIFHKFRIVLTMGVERGVLTN